MSELDVDATAVVIDKHTGRVKAHFVGFGAEADAKSFLRQCRGAANPKNKVDFLSSAEVITGDKAKKAIVDGRV